MRRILRAHALILAALHVSCSSGPEPGDLAGWNVLLVTIDTLRADRVGFMGYGGAETPVLDELAQKGVVFENQVASAPVTLPSHATILTGLYPPAHGALNNGLYSLPEDVPTLATALGSAGYRTGAFIGAVVLAGGYGLARGFDIYDDRIHGQREIGQAYRERRAEQVSELAAEWIRQGDSDEPFFAWIHYYDPHAPYAPPPAFRGRFRDPYDGEIAYTDESFGRVLGALRAGGLLERTLVIVTADHGEAFGDGGELTHGILLRGSTLRVPLVMQAPGKLPAGLRIDGVSSSADIAPTVLELLGVPPPEGMDGESLLGAIASGRTVGRYAYSETRLPADQYGWSMLAGVRGEEWAWVRAPRPELYDLTADPRESESVHERETELAAELDRRVERILAREHGGIERSELDEGQREALKSLGYVFTSEAPKTTGADPKDKIEILIEVNTVANHLENGDYERAVEAARSVLDEEPGNRDALLYLGQAQDGLGRTEEAVVSVRQALEAGGSLDLDGTLLAMYLMKLGRGAESEALLRSFCEAEPEFAGHPYNLGNLLVSEGRFVEAAEVYERAHELNPEAVHILANLANTLSKLEGPEAAHERAVQLIEEAIELAVDDDLPLMLKLEICERIGQLDVAGEVLAELQEKPQLRNVTREEVREAAERLNSEG